MKSIPRAGNDGYLNLYFQVHQPRRLRQFGFFDIGTGASFFNEEMNRKIMRRVAANCYEPANQMLLELIRQFPRTRLTFSISGVALEQLEKFAPEVIESFRKLAATGSVEFLGETYFHSLACLNDADEFVRQVNRHRHAMEDVLGVIPTVFRNTELIYFDRVGSLVRELGFQGIYADGIEKILQHKSPDHLYEHIDGNGLKLFLRNYSLSDDIAFRFSNKDWKEWPLNAEKYTRWLREKCFGNRLVNLGMDYETFGEHQKADAGILQFLKKVVTAVVKSKTIQMVTPSEAISVLKSKDRISVPTPISWADKERDLSAWLGNDLQKDAFDNMNSLGRKIAGIGDGPLASSWEHLQTSDHFYYMSTKNGDDGHIHNYFSPYASPYEAFINYMNILSDISLRLKNRKKVTSVQRDAEVKNIKQRSLLAAKEISC